MICFCFNPNFNPEFLPTSNRICSLQNLFYWSEQIFPRQFPISHESTAAVAMRKRIDTTTVESPDSGIMDMSSYGFSPAVSSEHHFRGYSHFPINIYFIFGKEGVAKKLGNRVNFRALVLLKSEGAAFCPHMYIVFYVFVLFLRVGQSLGQSRFVFIHSSLPTLVPLSGLGGGQVDHVAAVLLLKDVGVADAIRRLAVRQADHAHRSREHLLATDDRLLLLLRLLLKWMIWVRIMA